MRESYQIINRNWFFTFIDLVEIRMIRSVLYCCLVIHLVACKNAPGTEKLSNIILILADDLGYGELGSYGQKKIETPHLDALAARGMRFTNHYAGSPVCAPSRCVLLTGKHTGHAHIRGNDEWAVRGDVWNYRAMLGDSSLEGQRPLPDKEITLAELLKSKSYITGAVGKWGLGAPGTEGVPNRQGFDFFYGYNCQRQAHTYFPLHLYRNDKREYLQNDTVAPHTKLADDTDPAEPGSYAPFNLKDYAPELMFNEVIDFVNKNADTTFFLYWATPIPHVPLQAPKRWIEYYQNLFGPEDPYLGEDGYFPHQSPRAAYAAMISYLDENIGKLVSTLEQKNILENTLILFSSDNGPSFNGGTDSPWFQSAGPFRSERGRGKGSVYEGGIRVPLIISWPEKIPAGTVSNHVSASWDILPTLCEITGCQIPANSDGISMLPTLKSENGQQKHHYLYWEFPSYGGQRAVRLGKWKGVNRNLFDGSLDVELYDLETDSVESVNVALQYTDIVDSINRIFTQARKPAVIERFHFAILGDSAVANQ